MEKTNPGYGKFGNSWRGAGGYADRLSHSFRGGKRLRSKDYERDRRERPMCRSAYLKNDWLNDMNNATNRLRVIVIAAHRVKG